MNSGSTSTSNTGPANDHTFGNSTGHFMYIESSSPQKPNDTARLLSPVFYPNEQQSCYMRLFYHMRGTHINALNVYTELVEAGALTLKWSKKSEQGYEWKKATILLDDTRPFRVVVEGVRGTGYQGDIAIDDISFTPECFKLSGATLAPVIPTYPSGICKPGVEIQCDSNRCLPASVMCDFKTDCTDGTDEKNCPAVCDFETGTCGWSQDSSNVVMLTPPLTRPINASMGVTTDVNPGTSNGKVLQISGRFGRLVSMVSPLFSKTGPSCTLSFSFADSGNSVQKVSIRASGFENLLWKQDRRANSVGKWTKVSLKLPPCSSYFQVVLATTFSSASTGYLYIDDVRFDQCGSLSTRQCQVGEFKCGDGSCIPEESVCDLQKDCCDGSDEDGNKCYYYTKTTFEDGLKNWKNMYGEVEDWSIRQGFVPSAFSRRPQPSYDHTTHSQYGHYLLASFVYASPNATASIAYSLPSPAQRQCDISFWYAMPTDSLETGSTLQVFSDEAPQGQKLQLSLPKAKASGGISSVSSGVANNLWQKAHVTIYTSQPFQLVFRATHGVSLSSFFSVDDVSFSPGCKGPVLATPSPLPSTSTMTTAHSGKYTTSTQVQCNSNTQFRCVTSNTCISQLHTCDFQTDCSDGSDEALCHTQDVCRFNRFTSNLCTWKELTPDSLDWKDGRYISGGPSVDADQTPTPYAYVESSSPGATNQVATLVSKTFSSSSAACKLQFYYFIDGAGAGTLSLKLDMFDEKETLLWKSPTQMASSTTPINGVWVKTVVGIGRRSTPFTLRFQRLETTAFSGYMALDNLQFISCGLPIPGGSQCSADQYQCSTGACINQNLFCNFEDDCGDGSDEKNCAGYKLSSFENMATLDSFSQSSEDKLDWVHWQTGMTVPAGLSGADHTVGISAGHFLYVQADANTGTDAAAWLVSQVFSPTQPGKFCQVSKQISGLSSGQNELGTFKKENI